MALFANQFLQFPQEAEQHLAANSSYSQTGFCSSHKKTRQHLAQILLYLQRRTSSAHKKQSNGWQQVLLHLQTSFCSHRKNTMQYSISTRQHFLSLQTHILQVPQEAKQHLAAKSYYLQTSFCTPHKQQSGILQHILFNLIFICRQASAVPTSKQDSMWQQLMLYLQTPSSSAHKKQSNVWQQILLHLQTSCS